MNTSESIRVLITAGHPLVWQSIVHVLRGQCLFAVSGRSLGDFNTEVTSPADVVLSVIDPHSTDVSDIEELLTNVQAACPGAKLVCLFLSDDDQAVVTAVRFGVVGVVAGTEPDGSFDISELVSTISRVASGEFVMSGAMALRLARLHARESAPKPIREEGLTQREHEVLRLLAEGLTNREIANSLALSEHTVRSHLRGIMQKLQVTNRVQAAALAWSGSVAQ